MTTVLSLILLPLRAPMVLLLLLVSTYLGLHWSQPGSWAPAGGSGVTDLIWSAECLQALIVVVVCTMPDLLLRRLSSIMAASRVASLVITLLLVVTGGLYLLHLDVLSNVLILSSSVLLARLDLVRLRVVPPPFVMTLILSVLVLGGISLGRLAEVQLRPYIGVPPENRTSESPRRAPQPAGTTADRAPQLQPTDSAATPEGRPTNASAPAAAAAARPGESRRQSTREPDRAIPHLQENGGPGAEP